MKNNFISIMLDNLLLIFGLISLVLTVNGAFYYAGITILLASVYHYFKDDLFNFFKIGITHDFNSPSLFMIFAISPLILVYLLFNFKAWGFLGLLPIFLFAMAGVDQLKKDYYSKHKKSQFLLPLPIAALGITFLALILQGTPDLRFIIYAVVIIFCYLMLRPRQS